MTGLRDHIDPNRSEEFDPASVPTLSQVGVKECTSESYDFINQSFDIDRGDSFINATVAVIDSCRKMNKYCDEDELTFLSDPSGLVGYEVPTELCDDCSGKCNSEPLVGISEHGFFCAAIIASRRIPEARLQEISLGTVRGVSPPPRIALYGVGCPSCGAMAEEHMISGINAAISMKVDIISMSIAPLLPAQFRENIENFRGLDTSTLYAFEDDILVVVSAGNLGEFRLSSITNFPPWCLTVASCTSKGNFKTMVSFGSALDYDFKPIQGSSISIASSTWRILRRREKIYGVSSVMYETSSGFVVVEPTSNFHDTPSVTPLVYFTKDQSSEISKYLDIADSSKEDLCVKIDSSSKVEVADSPLVSDFSGRGPCSYYKNFMKPDISAPGEQIAAAWPIDVPLGRSGRPHFANYNVQSGTSFAVPQVAGAAAILRAEMNFSASAIISAIITTAKKMHGKETIAYEYAYGAGMLDVKRAMRPGLVYEENSSSYWEYLDQIRSHFELNLPYFSAALPISKDPWRCEFKRKVKSVEVGKSTYKMSVKVHATSFDMPLSAIRIFPRPTTLVFEDYGSEQEFTLVVRLPHTKIPREFLGLISGSLLLINEDNDEILVDSPIILSSSYVPSFHIIDPLYRTV